MIAPAAIEFGIRELAFCVVFVVAVLYTTFEGPKPTLIVSDPDLVKLVLVKHFQELPDRRHVKFHDPILDNMLTMLPLERWRKIRPAASPAFTTGKLRKVSILGLDSGRVLCTRIPVDRLPLDHI
ncbi:hypothetical protein HPB50_004484 [Hyalomma asiaticum]|uniref:Uncharacterized protein n=1 Tax=Hyalomma asiaticum TaxID=266040 RepID=A0ACB7RJE1_HYAAI|nr:hypothetical protein HPB50_004484 [Hyalomma asiaticum]